MGGGPNRTLLRTPAIMLHVVACQLHVRCPWCSVFEVLNSVVTTCQTWTPHELQPAPARPRRWWMNQCHDRSPTQGDKERSEGRVASPVNPRPVAPRRPAPTARHKGERAHALEVNLLKINARHGRSRDSNLENHCSARTDPHRGSTCSFPPTVGLRKARRVLGRSLKPAYLCGGGMCSMEVIHDHLAQGPNVLACDGALANCLDNGIVPDGVVGDMDSVKEMCSNDLYASGGSP